MIKKFFILPIVIGISLLIISPVLADESSDEWGKYLDVYNSDGFDKPVTPQEYKETMDALNNLKNRNKKNKKAMPTPHTHNAPLTTSNSNILRINSDLYYDNIIIPAGFYKIVVKHEDEDYYIRFFQGKTSIASIKAEKIKHTDFSPEKVSSLETKIIDDKYFKIMYKNIDIAICAYLAIIQRQ